MKTTFVSWCYPMIMVAALAWFGGTTPILADERDDRLNQLEKRLDEVIQHQKQILQHTHPMADRLGKLPPPGPEAGRPLLPPGPPRCPLAKCGHCVLAGLLVVASLCNILIAIWIFTDIRKRGEGHGIFIVLALLAGIPTGIIYALVRIGDRKSSS